MEEHQGPEVTPVLLLYFAPLCRQKETRDDVLPILMDLFRKWIDWYSPSHVQRDTHPGDLVAHTLHVAISSNVGLFNPFVTNTSLYGTLFFARLPTSRKGSVPRARKVEHVYLGVPGTFLKAGKHSHKSCSHWNNFQHPISLIVMFADHMSRHYISLQVERILSPSPASGFS